MVYDLYSSAISKNIAIFLSKGEKLFFVLNLTQLVNTLQTQTLSVTFLMNHFSALIKIIKENKMKNNILSRYQHNFFIKPS
jgi:hypothetical protein